MSRLLGLSCVVGCVPHLYTQDGPIELGDWVAPVNGWEINEPPATAIPEGFEPGQTAPDLRLRDQFGDEVSLWQFAGDLILLDVSTIWCLPCQALAEHTEDTWLAHRDEGFTYITVIQQDINGDPAVVEDAQEWAGLFGITAPVVADGEDAALGAVPYNGGTLSYPGVLLIGRDLRVIEQIEPSDHISVEEAIEAAL